MKIHSCSQIVNNGRYIGIFACSACEFNGRLEDAVWHIVENQFVVEHKEKKKEFLRR